MNAERIENTGGAYGVAIRTDYANGCAPLDATTTFRTLREARDMLALWLRRVRSDLGVVVIREAPGRYYAASVDGAWEGTRYLFSSKGGSND